MTKKIAQRVQIQSKEIQVVVKSLESTPWWVNSYSIQLLILIKTFSEWFCTTSYHDPSRILQNFRTWIHIMNPRTEVVLGSFSQGKLYYLLYLSAYSRCLLCLFFKKWPKCSCLLWRHGFHEGGKVNLRPMLKHANGIVFQCFNVYTLNWIQLPCVIVRLTWS